MSPDSHYIYFKTLSVLLLVLLLLFGSLNYFVDPYALFDSTRIKGFSELKPTAGNHVRMSKPYQVKNYSPRGLIAGNSRPEMGLNPDNSCWPEKSRPAYNLGLPGAGVYMQSRTIQHAIDESRVNLVLWGLDFSDFLTTRSKSPSEYKWPTAHRDYENRLVINADGSDNADYFLTKMTEFVRTNFSLDTAVDSLKTIFQQNSRNVSTRLSNGFNPANDYLPIIESEGQYVLFEQKNSEVNTRFRRDGLTVFPHVDKVSEDFDSVINLLKFAKEKDVTVKLFINPYHADYLSSIYTHGLWDEFEAWKLHLVTLAENQNVQVWDFSAIGPFNTEIPPVAGDKKSQLTWFWEPAHYKKEVGDMMLGQIFQEGCGTKEIKEIGVLLTSDNVVDLLLKEKEKIKRLLKKSS